MTLVWEKVKNRFGDYDYVSGTYRIEPMTDSYYRWYLYGARYKNETFKNKGQREFTKLKHAKEYAQKHADNSAAVTTNSAGAQ